jgi:hypothetical protein
MQFLVKCNSSSFNSERKKRRNAMLGNYYIRSLPSFFLFVNKRIALYISLNFCSAFHSHFELTKKKKILFQILLHTSSLVIEGFSDVWNKEHVCYGVPHYH